MNSARNPKHEILNPKQIQNPNVRMFKTALALCGSVGQRADTSVFTLFLRRVVPAAAKRRPMPALGQ